MRNTTNSSAIVPLSTNQSLAQALTNIADRLVQMAADGDDYAGLTQTEAIAQQHIRAFQMTKAFDLTGVMARYQLLARIRAGNMIVAANLQGISSENELAQAVGMTPTQLSREKDIIEVALPYVEEHLGISAAQWWETVTTASIGEVMPVIKVLLSGNPSISDDANRWAKFLEDEALMGFMVQHGEEEVRQNMAHYQREARQQAVEHLLTNTAGLPVREVRRQRRENTERDVIPAYLYSNNGTRLVVLRMTQEQFERSFIPTMVNPGRVEMNSADIETLTRLLR